MLALRPPRRNGPIAVAGVDELDPALIRLIWGLARAQAREDYAIEETRDADN